MDSIIITKAPDGAVTIAVDIAAILGLATIAQPIAPEAVKAAVVQEAAAILATIPEPDAIDAAIMAPCLRDDGKRIVAKGTKANTWHVMAPSVDKILSTWRTKHEAQAALLALLTAHPEALSNGGTVGAASVSVPTTPVAQQEAAKAPAKPKPTAEERAAAKAAREAKSALNKAAFAVLGGHKAAKRWAEALVIAEAHGWGDEATKIRERMAAA